MKKYSLLVCICSACISINAQVGINTSTPWEFIKGDSAVPYVYPVYGTQGEPAKGNKPCARYKSVTWKDGSGNLWLFGGYGTNSTGETGYLNDLWKYIPAKGQWIFMKGDNVRNVPGIYGIRGEAASSNKPGARQGSASWIDPFGNLWLFGGRGYYSSAANISGILNDLWKYDPSTNNWTWVKGDNASGVHGVYGSIGTAATTNNPGAREEPVSWIDSSGKLWLFGGYGWDVDTYSSLNDLWRYDTLTNNWTWMKGDKNGSIAYNIYISGHPGVYGVMGTPAAANKPGSRFRSHSWTDESGNLWLYGGDGSGHSGIGFLNDLWKFDTTSKNWTWIKGDSSENNTGVYGQLGQANIANKPGARYSGVSWADGAGNFWLQGGGGYAESGGINDLNDLWKYNIADSMWTWMKGDKTGGVTGVYGTQGTGASINKPGARNAAVSWKDGSGNLWLFGGATGPPDYFNDLWKFDTTTKYWTWVKGDNIVNEKGVYGEQGYIAQGNNPGARIESVSWKDNSGNMWLFGGNGFTTPDQGDGLKNDLWKYDPLTDQWTWMKGDEIRAATAVYGDSLVAAPTNKPGPRNSPVTWTDNSNNLWLFGGFGFDKNFHYGSLSDLWKYNPSDSMWTWMKGSDTAGNKGNYGIRNTPANTNNPGGRLRAMSWTDNSGKLWLFGGDGDGASNGLLNDLWKYDPSTNNWTWVKGDNFINATGVYGTLEQPVLANKPGARYASSAWADGIGNLWLQGGLGFDAIGNRDNLSDLWKYNIADSMWTWMKGDTTTLQRGVYGIKNTEDPANKPGSRNGAVSWKDDIGNFWLFGGYANALSGVDEQGAFNDLWRYNINHNNWTWMKGDSVPNKAGKFGTRLIGDSSVTPGATWRSGIAAPDTSGNLWLFGGTDNSANSAPVSLNTQLKYNVADSQWTWVKGAIRASNQGVFGEIRTPAPVNKPGARSGAVSWTDTTQNLWLFGGKDYDGKLIGRYFTDYLNDLWKFNPVTQQWAWVNGTKIKNDSLGIYLGSPTSINHPGSREKSVSWTDNNGKLWLFGGSRTERRIEYINSSYTTVTITKYHNDLWKYDPVIDLWIWAKGDSTINTNGIYGTPLIPDAANTPGAREGSISWKDSFGNLWLFGGNGFAESGSAGQLNDLWKYDTTNKWTWMKGDKIIDQHGVYGTQFIPNAANKPGARTGSISWIDNAGNLWLFGGTGFAESGTAGRLNDLWRYDTSHNWTWMKGDKTANASGVYGTKDTTATTNKPGAREGAIAWKNVYGNLCLSGGFGYNASDTGYLNDFWKYNPADSMWTWIKGDSTLNVFGKSNQPGARANAISWADRYGDLWLFGGYGNGTSGTGYLNDLWKIYSGAKYIFKGNGDWDTASNWVNSLKPDTIITPGMHVIINHQIPGVCVNHGPITLQQYGRLTVESQKKLTIDQGNFVNAGYVIGPGNQPGKVEFTGNLTNSLSSSGILTTPLVLLDKKMVATGTSINTNSIYLLNDIGHAEMTLNNTDINMDAGSTVVAGPANFFITNGTGKLIRHLDSNVPDTFHIGINSSSYTPVYITNTGVPDNFGIRVREGVYTRADSGSLINSGYVNRTWQIEKNISGDNHANITLQWNAADQPGTFVPSQSYVSHFRNCPPPEPCAIGYWDVGPVSDVIPNGTAYTQSRNITDSINRYPYFTVSSSVEYMFVNFMHDSNWNNANNWMYQRKPPADAQNPNLTVIGPGMEIIITEDCNFTGELRVQEGGKITVGTGKILKVHN